MIGTMTFNDIVSQFHFLRPLWLLVLIPVISVAWWYLRQISKTCPPVPDTQEQWASHVDSHLLPYLIIGQADREALSQINEADSTRSPNLLKILKPSAPKHWLLTLGLFMGLIASILAIAGPTWQQKPVPAIAGNTPTVIVLSLAQSMNADDVKPSRIQRAIHKVRDILKQTQGEERGLVIYSDTAFVATPLTSDSRVIQTMLPELSTGLMPVLGNRLDLAIEEAVGLLQRGGALHGNIIVLADSAGDDPTKSIQVAKYASQAGYNVSVLGIGTEQGGALITSDGRTAMDNAGNNLQTALDAQALQDLAEAGQGSYREIMTSDNDIEALINNTQSENGLFNTDSQISDSATSDWMDMGYWLLFIPLMLMPFAFRRGTFTSNNANSAKFNKNRLMSVLPLLFCSLLGLSLLTTPQSVYASDTAVLVDTEQKAVEPSIFRKLWDNLWLNTQQQAQKAFELGMYAKASELFKQALGSGNNNHILGWLASSQYKIGNYGQSAPLFNYLEQDYNLGNALAKSGNLVGALDAYERHLKQYPDDDDAIFNRDLVEKLLDEQKQQEQQQNKQNQNDKQDEQNQDQNQQNGENGQQDNQGAQDQQGESGERNDQNDEQDSTHQNAQNEQQQNGQQNKNQGTEGDNQKSGHENEDANSNKGSQGQSTGLDEQEANPAQAGEETGKTSQAFSPQPLDQATEQALRRVPDDSSGLLRARIMQHYWEQRYFEQQGDSTRD